MILGVQVLRSSLQGAILSATSPRNDTAPTITTLTGNLKDWLKKGELAIFDSIKEAEELGYEPFKSGPQRVLMGEAEIKQALVEYERPDTAAIAATPIGC